MLNNVIKHADASQVRLALKHRDGCILLDVEDEGRGFDKMLQGQPSFAPLGLGLTSIMTFIVNQQGRVYQKDLGPKTAFLAVGITEFDPDSTWQVSRD